MTNLRPMPDAVEFTLNQEVWFRTNAERRGVVTAVMFRGNGHCFGVTWDDLTERWHQANELVAERPVLA